MILPSLISNKTANILFKRAEKGIFMIGQQTINITLIFPKYIYILIMYSLM